MARNDRKYISDRVKVNEAGCWEWQLSCGRGGYGAAAGGRSGAREKAHRKAYNAFVGPIPDGLCVLHKCDNPKCCCPDHLFLGTQADNMRDKSAKARQARGEKNGGAKLTADKVEAIRTDKRTLREIASEHQISIKQAHRIRRGENWKHLGRAGDRH